MRYFNNKVLSELQFQLFGPNICLCVKASFWESDMGIIIKCKAKTEVTCMVILTSTLMH